MLLNVKIEKENLPNHAFTQIPFDKPITMIYVVEHSGWISWEMPTVSWKF